MALRFLNFASTWLLDRFTAFTRRWLASIREASGPLYNDYIEGLWGEYSEAKRCWRQKDLSRFDMLLKSLPWGIDLLRGICLLTLAQAWRILKLFVSSLSTEESTLESDRWNFWPHVPMHGNAEELIAGLCAGRKIEELTWMKQLIDRCKAWLQRRFKSDED